MNKNIREAVDRLHEGRMMQNAARRDIRAFLTGSRPSSIYDPMQRLRDMKGHVPYARFIEYAVTCIARGCDPDEVCDIVNR